MNRPRISREKREQVFSKTRGACYYCGAFATDLDHFVPRSYVANDTINNLIPACGICNAIAYNKHFKTLTVKKEYILEQRDSTKWRRRLARMEVTLISVDEIGRPIGIVEPGHTKSVSESEVPRSAVWEPIPAMVSKHKPNPLDHRPRKHRAEQATSLPKPIGVVTPTTKTGKASKSPYRKPTLVPISKNQVYKEGELRSFLKAARMHQVTWASLRKYVFQRDSIKTLQALHDRSRLFTLHQVYRLYVDYFCNLSEVAWLMGGPRQSRLTHFIATEGRMPFWTS